MAVFRVQLKRGGGISFGSGVALARFRDFAAQNGDCPARIETTGATVTEEIRGYYYGAVLPWLRSFVGGWKDVEDEPLHELLKEEFNGVEIYSPFVQSRKKRVGLSVFSRGQKNQKAMEYLERIFDWAEANHNQTRPDAEEYKRIRDAFV